MIHNSDKQRYDCGRDMKKQTNKQKTQKHSKADKIFFQVSAYD